ncbi:hypothetical protein ABK040_007821 [Willaertia magna]
MSDSNDNSSSGSEQSNFLIDKHIKYLLSHLSVLPHFYGSQDTNRMTILFFCVGGLDILNKLDTAINQQMKEDIINWIYSMQITPKHDNSNLSRCGFRGGNFIGLPIDYYSNISKQQELPTIDTYDVGHIAMTYTALALLRMLGDDYLRINRRGITEGLKSLQRENGCFQATEFGSETDIRFTFCACAISSFLDDWSGVNREKAFEYVVSSRGFDYCFSHGPGLESHGGSTYCAISALVLLDMLDRIPHKEEMQEWLLKRQISGFQGRPQKDADTCYSFWIGGTLKMLDCLQYIDEHQSEVFTLACQTDIGGIAKEQNCYPDVLHTYMSLAGLSLIGFKGLNMVYPPLNITCKAAKGLPCFDKQAEKYC